MHSVDEFLAELFHEEEYDPVKRREYYLRTRQLKGRPRGGASSGPVIERPGQTNEASTTRPSGGTTLPAKTPPKPAGSKTSIETRVAELQARLEKLRSVLRELVKQAKARSGVVEQPTKNPSTPSKPSDKKSTLTPQQQAAQEKAAREYYEKHKNEILEEQAKQLESQIKSVQEKIANMRAQLEQAAAKNKHKTGSAGSALTP